ncbi:MAG: hypothetical protein ACREP8_03445, partial [Candidatus Binatia bacterium]
MAIDDLEELESKVNRLLERHERVKRQKEAAEKLLQQKESESHHLKGQLRQFERQRSEVREKISK